MAQPFPRRRPAMSSVHNRTNACPLVYRRRSLAPCYVRGISSHGAAVASALPYRNPAAEVGVTELRKHRGSEMLTAMIYFLGWMWGIDPSGIIADARERALRTIDEKRLPWLEAEMS